MKVMLSYKLKLCLSLLIALSSSFLAFAQQICIDHSSEQKRGVKEGYRYELWNQHSQGTACMTLESKALFKGEWSGVENYLARRGLEFDQTKTHQELGNFVLTYDCNYQPDFGFSGNSYLSVYGWTVNPLVEYYIIEDWRNWIPSMSSGSTFKGTVELNGGIYDLYENTRVNQPSIQGIATFQQYFSIRRDQRNKGVVHVSNHFKEWERLGMNLGHMHEVSMVVEGYQNSGSFEFRALDVFTSSDTTVGTNEAFTESKFRVYPNPSTGVIHVDIQQEKFEFKVFNALGNIVGQGIINHHTDQITISKKGSYWLELVNKEERKVIPIIVK